MLFIEAEGQWIIFSLLIFACLILDLGVFHRVAHKVHLKEALLLSGFWVALSLLFNGWVFYAFGIDQGLSFLAAYLVEKSLSIDNVFVFVMIFNAFRVPTLYQHQVLFWGVLGAILMRGLFIYFGLHLIEKFHWILLFFGAFLIFTGFKMLIAPEKKQAFDKHPLLKFIGHFFPLTLVYHRQHFLIREKGRLKMTPLFAALLMVEFSDIVFAVDSIPAIFSITRDPFIVYTSNIFAILGLRSLYFVLSDLMIKFTYLKTGVSLLLCFVGFKMLMTDFYKMPTWASLFIIALILVVTIGASLCKLPPSSKKKKL